MFVVAPQMYLTLWDVNHAFHRGVRLLARVPSRYCATPATPRGSGERRSLRRDEQRHGCEAKKPDLIVRAVERLYRLDESVS